MTLEIRTAAVQIPNGTGIDAVQLEAYLAEPSLEGRYPAIVVLQEIFGVNEHIRQVTDRLAQEGYVAIAPAIFQRTAPGFEVGYDEAAVQLGRVHKDQTTAAQLLSDLQATISFLQRLPAVQTGAIGAIGFCFGGHVAYLAATLPAIKATASFYGAGIATLTPGGGAPTLTLTPQITGMLYAFFGEHDPLIPIVEVEQIEVALQTHGIAHRVFRYPTGHGFFCDHRADYDPAAAADAWEQVKTLFANCLSDGLSR